MDRRKDAERFRESLSLKRNKTKAKFTSVNEAIDHLLEICGRVGRNGKEPVQSSTVKYYRDITERARSYPWLKTLDELDFEDAKAFREWLLRNYSRDMSRRVLSCVSSAVTESIGHKNNPFIGVSISLDKEPVTIPSKADIRELMSAAYRLRNSNNRWISKAWERYYPMIRLMYATGMRTQELLAFPDFGLGKDHVKIIQALKRTGQIGKPKSKMSERKIPVDRTFLEPVEWYLKNRWIENDHRLIFSTEGGKPLSRENFRNKCWVPLMKEAGLVEKVSKGDGKFKFVPKFSPHAMRHYFASMQIANDRVSNRLSVKRIQSLLGHASIQMTYDVYGHLLEDEDPVLDNAIREAMTL
ncbi:MAG: site-specific integrase [Cyclobacteriaceae bacterium]